MDWEAPGEAPAPLETPMCFVLFLTNLYFYNISFRHIKNMRDHIKTNFRSVGGL